MRYRSIIYLAACFLAAFFLLAYPIYVIRPFRYQGARELAAALAILQYRQSLEIVLGIIAIILLAAAWRRAGVGRRVALGFLAILVIGCGLLTRINVYEKMFHPLERPAFSKARDAKLDGDEQVIAVRLRNVSRAYPIRGMSYHHIVNDTLGGRAIVATY